MFAEIKAPDVSLTEWILPLRYFYIAFNDTVWGHLTLNNFFPKFVLINFWYKKNVLIDRAVLYRKMTEEVDFQPDSHFLLGICGSLLP